MKLLVIAIVAVLLIIGLLTFLPRNITSPITQPIAGLFGRRVAPSVAPSPSPSTTTIVINSPAASVNVVSSPTPQPTINLNASPRTTITDPKTGSAITVSPTPTPAGSGLPLVASPSASSASHVASANLPGTGEETRDPIMLTLQALLAVLTIILGWKLSKYVR